LSEEEQEEEWRAKALRKFEEYKKMASSSSSTSLGIPTDTFVMLVKRLSCMNKIKNKIKEGRRK
jgi:hypothetical protein